MPEMPEVRTTAKYLNKDIKGKEILDITILVPKMIKEVSEDKFIKSIKNKKIIKVDNVAKFLVFHFDDKTVMLSHLRMEGKYRFQKEKDFGKHDHVIFKFKDGYLVYADVRKFGTFHIRNEDNYLTKNPILKMGPEPSSKVFKEVSEKLKRKSVPIKTALLDQTIVSGLGNIYVDEVLWKAKIHPLTKANNITEKQVLNILEISKKIMDKATKEDGSSISTYLAYNKIKGNYQNYLEVHTRAGEKCSRCKSKIVKSKVQGRGTYTCPKCQPLPKSI